MSQQEDRLFLSDRHYEWLYVSESDAKKVLQLCDKEGGGEREAATDRSGVYEVQLLDQDKVAEDLLGRAQADRQLAGRRARRDDSAKSKRKAGGAGGAPRRREESTPGAAPCRHGVRRSSGWGSRRHRRDGA
jgi:hypothetical protein